ncbi:sugar lactone lactonase YvrE [Duganella sp. SG902]|uniref:gluconolaconase n=1 Tax=Duganella sp. SG902 TaxID=2587016 RepID=UPI00159D7712|nr:sugar lactone lactonase YvrE [Duganella sp. SG902]
MSPTQFKLALLALALGGAAVGGGVAYVLVHQSSQHQEAGPVARPRAAGTPTGWFARVTTVAGDGLPGSSNGNGRRTRFADPFGVALDKDGNLYVADGGDNNAIRKIDLTGTSGTLAGGAEGYAEGKGGAAAFNTPSGLAIDAAGTLYVADTGNNAIRKITPDGVVSTLAGDGLAGDKDGKGAGAQFNGPVGVAVDAAGVVYVADTYNDRIRRIAPDGTVTTIAGGKRAGKADGPAAQALFDTPTGLAVSATGELYIADTANHAIRKLGKDGAVSTIAEAREDDRDSLLRSPVGIALSGDGFLYIASSGHGRVAQITPAGQVVALQDVDHPAQPGYGADGSVRLYSPRGIALASDGALFVTDGATFRLHHIAIASGKEDPLPDGPLPGLPAHSATMPWPVKPQNKPHEVVGLMGEVRGNFDGESRDHFHSGLDVQGAIGTPVQAVTAGKVTDPRASWGYGELSEGLAFGGMQYVHMRVGRDGKDKPIDARFLVSKNEKGVAASVRVKRGTRFEAGETLGTINRMAHVHLDYKPNGGPLNPLLLPFIDLEDTIAPEINSISVVGADGKPLTEKRDGRLYIPRSLKEVQIVVDASDQINGNQKRRRLGVYKLGYQLLNQDGDTIPGMTEPVITQQYDRLPRNREAVKLAYAASSGITVHGASETRFAYAINNRLINGKLTPGAWKVGELGPGNYILRITAEDYAGNAANRNRELAVTID